MPVHTPGKHQLPEPGGQQTEGSAGARGWDALPSSLASFGKVAYCPVVPLPEHHCEWEESKVTPGSPEGPGPSWARCQSIRGFLEREYAPLGAT